MIVAGVVVVTVIVPATGAVLVTVRVLMTVAVVVRVAMVMGVAMPVPMVMPVMLMAMVMSMPMPMMSMPRARLVRPRLGLERLVRLGDDQMHASEQIGEHVVGLELQVVGLQLDGDVAVAQVVGGAHQVARRAVLGAVAHDEHRLRGGLHAHEAAVVGDEYVAAAHDGAARQEDAEPAA